MPDCLTHVFFAEAVKKGIEADFNFNMDYFILGSQGPDPFFYYNYYPWKNTEGIDKFGSLIHRHETKKFLDNLLSEAKTGSSELRSFALGFLCHYILDTEAHPYIYYVTGIFEKEKKYRGNHLKLERGIDSIFIKNKGKTPRFYRVNKHFNLHYLTDQFKQSLDKVIYDTYNVEHMGKIYAHSYLDFKSNFNVLVYDPLGIKKVIYSVVDVFTSGSMLYKNLTHNINTDKHDYLNMKHAEWKHPVTGDVSTESFMDIYEKAIPKAVVLTEAAIKLFSGYRSNIFELTQNLDYNSGLECDKGNEMKYFKSIFN